MQVKNVFCISAFLTRRVICSLCYFFLIFKHSYELFKARK